MAEEEVLPLAAEEVTSDKSVGDPKNEVMPLAAKPAIRKAHLHIMNAYDCATLLDLTPYPGLSLGSFLTLPRDWIVAHWNLS